MRVIFVFCLVFMAGACTSEYCFKEGKIINISTIEDLDKAALFNFAIMSDNKGVATDSVPFRRMVDWIRESNDQFVIGLGDHLCKGWGNRFLSFLHENNWWHNNFYPNVADGENQYYGESQGDWGAGAPILDEVDLADRPHVVIRNNKCEYYAIMRVKGCHVHLIQLHYSDTPSEDSIAFNESTKNYMVEVLRSIEKGCDDIIILAAHSRTGFWTDQLSEAQLNLVMNKCDLMLSATVHRWERKVVPGYYDEGPLIVNTGCIISPSETSPIGYVQVHVLKKPLSLVVQYIDANNPERDLQSSPFAFLKIVGGKTFKTNFK